MKTEELPSAFQWLKKFQKYKVIMYCDGRLMSKATEEVVHYRMCISFRLELLRLL